jgi:hypothetical protein
MIMKMHSFFKRTAGSRVIGLGLFCWSIALAVGCPQVKAQGTYTAASCNYSDVNAVINGPVHTAKNGDTIHIPSGSCSWTNTIVVPRNIGITIMGNGTPNSGAGTTGAGTLNTTIIDNIPGGALFWLSPTLGNSLTRISTLNLVPGARLTPYTSGTNAFSVVGICTASGCPNLRVDNLSLSGWQTAVVGTAASIILTDNVWGVADHNTVIGDGSLLYFINANQSAWLGVGAYGDNSWATADTFGTAQAMYFENNLFTNANASEDDYAPTGGGSGGARDTCRFNTYDPPTGSAVICGGHGTSSTGRPRSVRQVELYHNTITAPSPCDAIQGINGGVALNFNNNVSGPGCGALISITSQRRYYGPFVPWGMCDGTGPYDQNHGTVYASGTVTTGGTNTFIDSTQSWTTNQWAGSAATNGKPYSVHNVTQNFGAEIAANTSNQVTITLQLNPGGKTSKSFNAGDTYEILCAFACSDQPGRGQGDLLSGVTPKPGGWVGQVLDPVYEWADTTRGIPAFENPYSAVLIANRDYYGEQPNQTEQTSPTSPFNGATGTGHGTLANRPTSCTAGVAYWATDQGSWNTSGIGGQGQLYKCSSTNTWTLAYTPFTYPHPLATGSTSVSSGNPPNPPTGLTATVQ